MYVCMYVLYMLKETPLLNKPLPCLDADVKPKETVINAWAWHLQTRVAEIVS